MDPYLGMQIVNQRRKEAEREAAAFRLWRDSGLQRPGQVARLSWQLVGKAGSWLSALGSWLEGQGVAGEPPLDGWMRPSHRGGG